MKTNDAGIVLIKSFESCVMKAYRDLVGVVTCGFGHTGPDITIDTVWTQEQADNALAEDLARFEEGVTKLLKVPVSSNQFSALVSFSYNLGLGSLAKSTLLELLNNGLATQAADQFEVWNHANGHVVDGLTRRRLAEKALFLS